jgi:choline dehydrogenase-like flavoprotein
VSQFSLEYLGNITEAGLFGPATSDYNGGTKNGPSLFQWLRYRPATNRTDRFAALSRMTSMNSLLTARVQQRTNLIISTDTPVLRVLFKGITAVGIEYLCHGDRHSCAGQKRSDSRCGGLCDPTTAPGMYADWSPRQ